MSKSIPKPLTQLMGQKSILELKLENYITQGWKEFVLCTGYKSELIEEAVQPFQERCSIEISYAGRDVGILERLYFARTNFGNHGIMTYGDTFTNIDLEGMAAFHKESKFDVTIASAAVQNPFGLIEFDESQQVSSFREKPLLNHYIGYAVIASEALRWIPKSVIEMEDGLGLVQFFNTLIAMDKLGTWRHPGLQVSFNTEAELNIARKSVSVYFTLSDK